MTRFLQQLGELEEEKTRLGKHIREVFYQFGHKNGIRLVMSQILSALIGRGRAITYVDYLSWDIASQKALWKCCFGISVPFQAQTQTTSLKLLRIHMLTLVNKHIDNIQFIIYSGCISAMAYFIFLTLEIWRSVSRGYFLHICPSFLSPSLRGRKWPTSPPASPLTPRWWWASSLNIFRSTSPVHV